MLVNIIDEEDIDGDIEKVAVLNSRICKNKLDYVVHQKAHKGNGKT